MSKTGATHKKNIWIPFLLFTLFFPLLINAQTIFKGQIKNALGEPLSHTTILVAHHQHLKVLADSNGYFSLSLPNGTFKLSFHAVGYENHTQEITVPDEGVFEIVLKPSVNSQLSHVTINGLGKGVEKHRIETSGYAVNVIDTKDAALQNMQTIDLLDRSAGVRVRQNGGLGGTVEYNINGLSGNAIKIFIDGIPISNYGRSFSLNSIPPALIERIEVYKGVIPGHLSEDALGGAINVILKKGLQNNFTTSYSYGSFNTHQWNATGSYQFKNSMIVKGSAFYNYSDNSYKVWGDDILFYEADGSTSGPHKAKRFNDAFKSKSLKVDWGYVNNSWADQFFVSGLISDQMKELQHGVSMRMVYGNRHSRQNSKVGSLIYTKNNLFLKGLSVNLNSSYSYLERENIDTVGDRYDWRGRPIINPNTGLPVQYANGAEQSSIGKTLSVNTEKTFVVRSNISYALNENNAVFANILYNTFKRGVDDSFRDDTWRNFQNTRDLTKQIYSFTYQNIAFDGKLRTNVFFKSYHQQVNSHEPRRVSGEWLKDVITRKANTEGYGMTFSYRLLPKLYILASGERAVRLPSEGEMFGNDVENEISNYNLKPERSTNANLGFNIGPYVLQKHSISLNSSIFYREVKDMIRRAISADSRDVASYENLNSVMTYGFDAEILYKYDNLVQLNFNISKFNALFNTEYDASGSKYSYYKEQIRNEPSFKFSSGLTYFWNNAIKKNARASIYYNTNYVGRFLRDWAGIGGTGLNWIPTQFVHDLGIAYTLPNRKTTIAVDAKNIFNAQIFDNFRIQKPGRAFYAKLTYSIF